MATKYPQEPLSRLAQILCDANLDYLGRPDFVFISASLFHELNARQLIANERAWFGLQAGFLAHHHYWTATALDPAEPRPSRPASPTFNSGWPVGPAARSGKAPALNGFSRSASQDALFGQAFKFSSQNPG